mmetsp:Transcript_21797/g.40575  ORF Transcript_21797/g.40575 Transcript_21797/m.40575 type:complete len:227 (-) Transcript_21797:274-954(-)
MRCVQCKKSLDLGSYCADCWLTWLADTESRLVLTLCVNHSDQEEQLEVSCLTMSGQEVFKDFGFNARYATIGHLRELLYQSLDLEFGLEQRMVGNGRFYSKQEYTEWCNDRPPWKLDKLRQEWKKGQVFWRDIALVLPDGCLLSNDASLLAGGTSLSAGEVVEYIGNARKVSGSTLTKGTKGEVVLWLQDGIRVRFPKFGTVRCADDELKQALCSDTATEPDEFSI